MTKNELRKIYLARQKNLSPGERERKSRQIADSFFLHFDLNKIKFLHCFLPIARTNETNTNLIIQRIWREFPRINLLVPRVNFASNEIENLKYEPTTKLVSSKWQISEPVDDEKIKTEKIDAVLVPLLCFDKSGLRVGYGKGFYDRFLKNCRADSLKIGLSYFAPTERISDAQKFDVPLDFCITPETIARFKPEI